MKADSLEELKTAFDLWRRKKRYARVPVFDELLKRARRAIEVHGLQEVVVADHAWRWSHHHVG